MEVPDNVREELKKEGINEEDIEKAVKEYEKFGDNVSEDTEVPQGDYSDVMRSSAFESKPSSDVVKFQLELNDILERVEHILRGDKIEIKNGNRIYVKNTDPDAEILNEKGVQILLNFISTYVTRNTLLANYKKEEIDKIMFNIGIQLNNLIYMRYEEMGMDNSEKRKMYPSLVSQIVDLIRNSYTRAIGAGERKSLTQTTHVTQTQSVPIEENQEKQYKGIFRGVRP